jgi:hypothetical protein
MEEQDIKIFKIKEIKMLSTIKAKIRIVQQ